MTVSVARVEAQKRAPVFTMERSAIKFCLHGRGPFLGLEGDFSYDPEKEEKRRTLYAKAHGLDPSAYRDGGHDTGFQLFNCEPAVRISILISQLSADRFCYVGGGWHKRANGKCPVNVLEFRRDREEVDMPPEVEACLGETFRFCAVWLNPEPVEDGSRLERVDCINLNMHRGTGAQQKKNVRQLVISGEKGGTYALEPVRACDLKN